MRRLGVGGRTIAGLTQSCKTYYRTRDAGDCVAYVLIDAGEANQPMRPR